MCQWAIVRHHAVAGSGDGGALFGTRDRPFPLIKRAKKGEHTMGRGHHAIENVHAAAAARNYVVQPRLGEPRAFSFSFVFSRRPFWLTRARFQTTARSSV